MKFFNEDHEKSYQEQLKKCNIENDTERKALIYLLTLTDDLRNHFTECYDKNNRLINSDVINASWVTSTDAKIIRLAFNLFNWGMPTVEKGDKAENYLPINLFNAVEYQEYFFEAIRIRFEIIS